MTLKRIIRTGKQYVHLGLTGYHPSARHRSAVPGVPARSYLVDRSAPILSS